MEPWTHATCHMQGKFIPKNLKLSELSTHTMRARTFVSVVVCVSRKLCPCPSYSGRRDRNNSVRWRSLYKGGGGGNTEAGGGGASGGGGVPQRGRLLKLDFPSARFWVEIFFGWVGLRAERPPPTPSYKQSLVMLSLLDSPRPISLGRSPQPSRLPVHVV